MKKSMRTLLLSMIVLCMCTALIAGGTFALFSDEEVVSNHLAAGNLKIALTRIDYRDCVLDENGFLVESKPDDEEINLVTNGAPLFDAVDSVPESWYQATIKVENMGTTAYNYGMRILWNTKDDASAEQKLLASQIEITVTSDKIDNETHSVTFMLSECADNHVPLGYMLKGAKDEKAETFTVKAKFVDHDDNNDAMNVSLSFDVQVWAEQKTSL